MTFSLHSAGHVLGSAQAAAECGGTRVVASGDYKRQPDPTCAPFEVVPCDVFITEATFALPVFTHPSAENEVRKLLASVAMFPERAHIVGAYALGKAQRVMADVACARVGISRSMCMARCWKLTEALSGTLGVELRRRAPCRPTAPKSFYAKARSCSARQGRIADALGAAVSGSGDFSCIGVDADTGAGASAKRGAAARDLGSRRLGSDLQRTIKDTGAGEIWITHGEAEALAHWCEGSKG